MHAEPPPAVTRSASPDWRWRLGLRGLSRGALGWLTLGLTLLGEAGNLFLRYGLGWQSARDTIALAPWTAGLRIHHCYLGALAVFLGLACRPGATARRPLLVLGAALVLSGLLHHGAVLWWLDGAPAFSFYYPGYGP